MTADQPVDPEFNPLNAAYTASREGIDGAEFLDGLWAGIREATQADPLGVTRNAD